MSGEWASGRVLVGEVCRVLVRKWVVEGPAWVLVSAAGWGFFRFLLFPGSPEDLFLWGAGGVVYFR